MIKSVKSLLFVAAYSLLALNSWAQPNITQAEYFFDTDPGFGNGTAISVTPASDVTLSFSPDVSSLANGFHVLYVRGRDASNRWSNLHARGFVKFSIVAPPASINITQAEYFFDTDPGFGNGTAISVTPASDVTLVVPSVDLSSLADGFHVLYVRGRDASNRWSNLQARGFVKFSIVAPPASISITQAEYFFDTDPGFGNGTAISVTPASDVTIVVPSVDLSSLVDGFHVLYVRGRDASNRWSNLHARGFVKFSIVAPPASINITQAEYFIDRDPGFGRGTQVPITPAADLTQTFTVDLTTIPSGTRQLYIRGRDAAGKWSVLQMVQFNDTGADPPNDGTATVNVTGNGTVDFPGTALQIVFSGVSGSGNVVVTRFLTLPQNVSYVGTPPVNTSQYRWVITNDPSLTAFNAQLRFDAIQIPGAGIVNPAAVNILARQNTGNGSFETIAMSPPSGNTIIGTVNSFSEFVLGSDASNSLPVELSSFTASSQNGRIALQWTTASEKNNAGFEVQRRSENQGMKSDDWQVLGFVRGNGTTSEAQSYSLIDRTATGKVSYRLKQIDFDGQFEYSNTIEADAGLPKTFTLEQNYPNPFNPSTTINYQIPVASDVRLVIYDMLGREVATLVGTRQEAGRYAASFNASGLTSGMYFYQLQAGTFMQTKKMLLIK